MKKPKIKIEVEPQWRKPADDPRQFREAVLSLETRKRDDGTDESVVRVSVSSESPYPRFMEDPESGEVPATALVLKKGAAYDGQALQSVLNKLEMPKEIKIMDKLPLNAAGKTDKIKIRESFQQGHA